MGEVSIVGQPRDGAAKAARQRWNGCRLSAAGEASHGESYTLVAHAPDDARSLVVRYSLVRPEDRRTAPFAEASAVYAEAPTETLVAARERHPLERCAFAADHLGIQIGHCVMTDDAVYGTAKLAGSEISWDFGARGGTAPFPLLPESYYSAEIPGTKPVLVGASLRLDGELIVRGVSHDLAGWRATQSHAWSTSSIDDVAYGLVDGFDDAPDTTLQCSLNQLTVGPWWHQRTVRTTALVLRHEGQEFLLNGVEQTRSAQSELRYFDWVFESASDDVSIDGRITAPRYRFVAVTIDDPLLGPRTVLRTPMASCQLTIHRPGCEPQQLTRSDAALLELVATDDDHKIARLW